LPGLVMSGVGLCGRVSLAMAVQLAVTAGPGRLFVAIGRLVRSRGAASEPGCFGDGLECFVSSAWPGI
jgi:hypothetical protein